MRMRLRWLVVGLLVLVLAAGGWLLGRGVVARGRADRARAMMDILPDVAQRIQNFHRVKIDNGRKVWEVSAREAQYREDEQLVVVDEPRVEVFLEDGRVIALRGTGGRVLLRERELAGVELAGDIEVQLGEYALRTEAAHYDAARRVIVAPGEVRITGRDVDLVGHHMEVDVATEQLVLSERVETTLWPRS